MSSLTKRLAAIESNPALQQAANRRRFFELVEQPGIEKCSDLVARHPEMEPLPAGVEIYMYYSHPDPAQLESLPPTEIWQVMPHIMTNTQADTLTQQLKACGCKYMSFDFGYLADMSDEPIPALHRDIMMRGVRYADAGGGDA